MSALVNSALPEDLDLEVEEESLYRRRQRNIDVRRSRFPHRVRRVLAWLFFGSVLLASLGYGGIQLAGYAFTSPRFRVTAGDDVVVEGNRYVSREEIVSALGLPLYFTSGRGVSIFRLNLDEERKQVESIPWVRSAIVSRVFPNRLAVSVAERVPVAFVNIGGSVKLVDGDGFVLEKPDKGDFTFPVLEGLDARENSGDREARLEVYQDFMQQLASEAPAAGWLISEVDVGDSDDLRAILVQGRETIELHFGRNNFLERFRNFIGLLPELRKSNTQIDSVDLRYRNQVVVNPKKTVASDK